MPNPIKVDAETCPVCKGVPEEPEIENCHGGMCCDFSGTKEGYHLMQRLTAESFTAEDAMLAEIEEGKSDE